MTPRVFFLCIFYISTLYSEQKDGIYFKNGIENPSQLAIHHFGIFRTRIQQNFKRIRAHKTTLRLTAESGNTSHLYVSAYLRKVQHIREEFSAKNVVQQAIQF